MDGRLLSPQAVVLSPSRPSLVGGPRVYPRRRSWTAGTVRPWRGGPLPSSRRINPSCRWHRIPHALERAVCTAAC